MTLVDVVTCREMALEGHLGVTEPQPNWPHISQRQLFLALVQWNEFICGWF